jgi:hypothetical protein
MYVDGASPALVSAVRVMCEVLNLLALDGTATTGVPYRQRRELLAGLGLRGDSVRVPGICPARTRRR